MAEIYIARHPETVLNADRSVVGGRSNDAQLTNRGFEQACRFAVSFDANYPKPDVLISSPAIRATALMDAYLEATQQQTEYTIEPALQEMSQGIADGRPRALIYTPEVVEQINRELFDFKLPEGESVNEVSDRMLDWVWRVHREFPNSVVLTAGHGQAIRSTVGHLLGWTHYQTTQDPDFVTPNVSLTHLSVADDAITVDFYAKEIINPVN